MLSQRYDPNGNSNSNLPPPVPNKFVNLYEDAQRRKERQDKIYSACMESECTFQPDTNQTKYYYQKLEIKDPGYQQKRSSSRDRSQKRNATFNNDLFDPESGQPFFKPKVGRGPKNLQRPGPKEKDIGQYLYQHNQDIVGKLESKKKTIEDERD